MLTELSIRDIALIERLTMRFGAGLNVISGETGAGKSLIVGSLRLLCGEKPPADFVRTGAERGVVEGIFELDPDGWIAGELAELGIDLEDGELIVRREIPAAGKGRVRANGQAITLATLAKVSERLVDLHGQHDHQALLQPLRQREALDDFASVGDTAAAFGRILNQWRDAARALRDAEAEGREATERLELARFQKRELEEAAIERGELAALAAERGRLERAEFLRETAARLETRLTESDDSIHDALSELAAAAREAADHDPDWTPTADALDSLAIGAGELTRDVRTLGERAVDDPERLEVVRERMRLLQDLLRKYGPSEDELFAFLERRRAEETDPQARERRLTALRERLSKISDKLAADGATLTRRRRATARKLERAVVDALGALGMGGTRFEVGIAPRGSGTDLGEGVGSRFAGPSGFDSIEFRLAANRGEELRPLRNVASGGEISRVMLAMKSVLGTTRGTASMVFDEIDIGVGGLIARRIADAMAGLAADRQVICITHLAAIASRADAHLRVAKREVEGRTVSDVEPVSGEERVREIARMLGGGAEKGVAVEHARELLEEGRP